MLTAVSAALAALSPVKAAVAGTLPDGDHKSTHAVDTDTPAYYGYNSDLKAYHYHVQGRWVATCGDSNNFCWPTTQFTGGSTDIGSNDAVDIEFDAPVDFVKLRVQTFDACGDQTYDHTSKPASSNSFQNAYASVNDALFPGWTVTDASGPGGSTHTASGPCKLATEPQSGIAAGGGGGSATVQWWNDLRGRSYELDVWVNPTPPQGDCYTGLRVKGGYTHTWTDSALTWGIGYPFGVSAGWTDIDGKTHTTQGTDFISDPDLVSPKVCNH
ncbi:MAG: hypothetical protein QM747_12380 [Nocardioides sp.]